MASRNGRLSMSPTVPPNSLTTRSTPSAAALQEIPDGRGREALPQRRHHPAGHKDEFRHAGLPPICTPPLHPPAPAPLERGLFPWPKRASVVARSWLSDVFIDALLPV